MVSIFWFGLKLFTLNNVFHRFSLEFLKFHLKLQLVAKGRDESMILGIFVMCPIMRESRNLRIMLKCSLYKKEIIDQFHSLLPNNENQT